MLNNANIEIMYDRTGEDSAELTAELSLPETGERQVIEFTNEEKVLLTLIFASALVRQWGTVSA